MQNLKSVPVEVRGPVPLGISVLEFYSKASLSFPGSDWTPRKLEGFIQAPQCSIHTKLVPCLRTSFNCSYPVGLHPCPIFSCTGSLNKPCPWHAPYGSGKSNTFMVFTLKKSQPWDFSWSLTSLSLGVLAQSMERACEQNIEKWDVPEDVNTLMLTFFCSYFNQLYYFLQLGQETSSFFTTFDSFKF